MEKTEVSCAKFQANVFDRSRCQNCFKSRELHVTTREELEQVKPVYASWLCLAPEGLDFDNLMQRSRKWQRRFFILYEHGCLEFALDELPSTIPQGTVNLNQCSDVIDAEGRTGQKNTLCIVMPDQEIYIRGDSKEIINGWCEQLLVFLQSNEQKRRKKGRMTHVSTEEEASAMKSVCSIGAANTGAVEDNELCNPREEDEPREETEGMNISRDENGTPAGTDSLSTGKLKTVDIKQETLSLDIHQAEGETFLQLPLQHHSTSHHSPEPSAMTSNRPLNSSASQCLYWQENTEKLKAGTQQDKNSRDSCLMKCSMTGDACWTNENAEECEMCPQCSFRNQSGYIQNMEKSVGLLEAQQSDIPPLKRQQSMKDKPSEPTMTPDLLNFKKGWLFMDDHDQWRKYWFMLSAHSLHYYIGSGAEEPSQLVGEIDLTTCHRVIEIHDQRNFAFEIWTLRTIYKLATVTAGMRQNWIQALTKNIQDQKAPDVASIPDNCPPRVSRCSGPDVTQDSMSLSCNVSDEHCRIQRSDQYRTLHGHPNATSWTEMLTQQGTRDQDGVNQNTEENVSRRRGREERRKSYAKVMHPLDEMNSSTQEDLEQERMREIEECWLQLEKMVIRDEKRVLLFPLFQNKDSAEQGKHLEHNREREPTYDPRTKWDPQKMGPYKQNPCPINKYEETEGHVHSKDPRTQQSNELLDLYPLSQYSSEFTNEPERKCEHNKMHEGIISDNASKSLRSLALCQASSRDFGDDGPWARMFSERTAMMGEDSNSEQTMVKLLSQKAEFLTRQNVALNQRNQELVNQLAEADREIDRLKAEHYYQPSGHQPEPESIVNYLELELNRICGQLKEAQHQLAEMEDNLKDTHQTLQLKEDILKGMGFFTMGSKYKIPEIIDRLHQCVQMLEVKVSELENQQRLSTPPCKEPQSQNTLPMKPEVYNDQKIMVHDQKSKMFNGESNMPQCEDLVDLKDQQHQNRLETVEEELKKRSSVLSLLLKVISQLSENEMPYVSEQDNAQMNSKVLRRLQLDNDIWKSFVNILKNTNCNSMGNEEAACLLQSAEMKLEEVQMYISALSICNSSSSNPLTLRSVSTGDTSSNVIGKKYEIKEEEQNYVMWKGLKQHMEKRLDLIAHVRSKLELFSNNEKFSEIKRQGHIWKKTNTFDPMISVVMDIMVDYLVQELSHSKIMHKCVAIQTENQEMKLEQSMSANAQHEFTKDTGKETISNVISHTEDLDLLLSERLSSLCQQHEKDKERLKAAFEHGIILLKESHRKATEVLLTQQREQELLQEEKEKLLTEEVAACLTVIEAMKKAHNSELEKMQKACQEKTYSGGTNIDIMMKKHSEEFSAVQRELDALSGQYAQKCLENVHLAEALQAERNALQQHQCQNLALSAHNQELTSRLAKEIMRSLSKDGCNQLVHDGDQYELMIKLQLKESFQEQEIDSLKKELSAARIDQKVAADRVQEIQTELQLVKETAEQHISQLKENLRLIYKALEESIKREKCTKCM